MEGLALDISDSGKEQMENSYEYSNEPSGFI
jgi:hypothetical protein